MNLFLRDWYLRHVKKPRCSLCGQIATLRNDNGSWICKECAEVMNDLGIENGIGDEK
ncbi:hypothetical protein V4W88_08325 [Pediococcus acidilactici]|uniref:hypothetical protein n=1 Tax=Pediococcus acidilactici TaxID=1254 RepID=UPI002FBE70B7